MDLPRANSKKSMLICDDVQKSKLQIKKIYKPKRNAINRNELTKRLKSIKDTMHLIPFSHEIDKRIIKCLNDWTNNDYSSGGASYCLLTESLKCTRRYNSQRNLARYLSRYGLDGAIVWFAFHKESTLAEYCDFFTNPDEYLDYCYHFMEHGSIHDDYDTILNNVRSSIYLYDGFDENTKKITNIICMKCYQWYH
jgi:hypothetical protein